MTWLSPSQQIVMGFAALESLAALDLGSHFGKFRHGSEVDTRGERPRLGSSSAQTRSRIFDRFVISWTVHAEGCLVKFSQFWLLHNKKIKMSSNSFVLPPSLSLAGKAAIVTGSSRGIGRGLALVLAQRGAVVAITYTSDSSTAQAESLATEINALTRACIIKADLASIDCGPEIIQGALQGLGVAKIDILVNNAAVGPPPLPATDFDSKEYDSTMKINLRAPMLLVKELLPVLSEKDGRIINMCVPTLCCDVQISFLSSIVAKIFHN